MVYPELGWKTTTGGNTDEFFTDKVAPGLPPIIDAVLLNVMQWAYRESQWPSGRAAGEVRNGLEAIFEIIQREDARNLPYDLQDEAPNFGERLRMDEKVGHHMLSPLISQHE